MKQTVKQYISLNPVMVSPNATLEEAAAKMEDIDCGVLPVGTAEKPVGMVTDRDIVLRALAKKRNPATTRVSEVMSPRVFAVAEDASVENAVKTMQSQQVSRLLVLDVTGRVIGLLSLGHLVRESDATLLARIFQDTRKKAA